MLNQTKPSIDLSNLASSDDWSFSDVSRSNTATLTHSYHRYPAKFIPQLVDRLIQQFTQEGDLVVDPFGGCGTTLVEAKLNGRRGVGFDVNPIAKLITQTKITPVNPAVVTKAQKQFEDRYLNSSSLDDIKHHDRLHYWFDDQTLYELDKIYDAISGIADADARRFYLCAFSHNLKNSSRWLMKSIKPTIDKNKKIPNPLLSFNRHLKQMIRKNDLFYKTLLNSTNISTESKVYQTDSTKKWPVKDGTIDLIVTSPPYVTSYEYADLHQLSLLWFGSDQNQFKRWHNRFTKDFIDFRKDFIGTSSKPKKIGELNSPLAQSIVKELMDINRPLAKNVANYFIDMKKVFTRMYEGLKPGGVAGVIIGNTALRGVKIKNAEVAIEQMERAGFEPIDFIKRDISSKVIAPWRDSKTGKFTGLQNPDRHRVYEYEYVIIMRKPIT